MFRGVFVECWRLSQRFSPLFFVLLSCRNLPWNFLQFFELSSWIKCDFLVFYPPCHLRAVLITSNFSLLFFFTVFSNFFYLFKLNVLRTSTKKVVQCCKESWKIIICSDKKIEKFSFFRFLMKICAFWKCIC